jgi:hypothetical protein
MLALRELVADILIVRFSLADNEMNRRLLEFVYYVHERYHPTLESVIDGKS